MKNAIVTGASGFVGKYLVGELLENGYRVLAVIRDADKIDGAAKYWYRGGRTVDRIKVVVCDMADIGNLLENADEPYDFFFHLAWDGVSGALNMDYVTQMRNIQYAVDSIKVASMIGCRRFIGTGSIHEIECRREMETPTSVSNRANYYKIAKLAAHYYCKLEAMQQGIDFIWPRLTNTFGVGEMSKRLIVSLIRQLLDNKSPALTKADQLYTFLYITDVARAWRLIAENGVSYRNYIVGSEQIMSLKEYLVKLQQVVNPGVELGFGLHEYQGVYLSVADLYTNSFFLDTGFKEEVGFEEGIRQTASFIREQKQTI